MCVQLNALYLNIFALLICPIAIASLTPVMWLSLCTTAITVASYYALFIVANQMEDPFGTESNVRAYPSPPRAPIHDP